MTTTPASVVAAAIGTAALSVTLFSAGLAFASGASLPAAATPLRATATAAATARPVSAASPAALPPGGPLRVTARVDLGPSSTAALDVLPDAEAPDGTFYFASGSAVETVRGAAAPAVLQRTSGKVVALAATATELYVQVGLSVLDYSLPTLHLRRTWALTRSRPAPSSAPTSSGLLAGGGVVWSWDDWSTDASGFEYATLDELSASPLVSLVDANAYPADMAADASGLSYETEIGVKGYLAHVTPAGRRSLSKPTPDTDSPMVLSDGSVILLTVRQPSGTPYVDRFSEATLGLQSSAKEKGELFSAVDTSAGVLVISCNEASCVSDAVVRFDPQDATTSGAVPVPGLATLVRGSDPAALAAAGGRGWLVRLGTSAGGTGSSPVLGSKTFRAPSGAGWGTVKPRDVSNGGDPSGTVQDLAWSSWGTPDAYGYGESSIFKPGGGYYPGLVEVELRASDLGHCAVGGPLAYEHLAIRVPSRPGGPLGGWLPWGGANGSICATTR